MVFPAFVTAATPRTPASGRAYGTPSLNVWYFDRAWSAGALGFARFPPLTSVSLLDITSHRCYTGHLCHTDHAGIDSLSCGVSGRIRRCRFGSQTSLRLRFWTPSGV